MAIYRYQTGSRSPWEVKKQGITRLDQSKIGTKRHLLIDGKRTPLAFHLIAANRHDMKGIPELIGEGFLTARSLLTRDRLQRLCIDKAYDAPETDEFLQAQGYILHTKRSGKKLLLQVLVKCTTLHAAGR
ncbi:MAG: transposase [bacterium]